MISKVSYRLLLVLSVLYGLIIALLGAFDRPVKTFAIVGALVVGGLWALRGILADRAQSSGVDRRNG